MNQQAHIGRRRFVRRLRRRVFVALEEVRADDPLSKTVQWIITGVILLNVLAVVLESVEEFYAAASGVFDAVEYASVGIFTIEYIFRVWVCVEQRSGQFGHPVLGRLRYMVSPFAAIDLVAVLPFYLGTLVGIDLRFLRVLRLLRMLKLTRQSGAWSAIGAVLVSQRREFFVAAALMGMLLVLTSSLMYLAEHDVQPDKFANIPAAMWWGIVTLATIGYGDVTPVTPFGKLLGGVTAILGVMMYALPAGILASGFVEEFRKRRFVVTWGMVARVPYFSRLKADEIAEIAELLKPEEVPPHHTIIRRGDPGDSMYFIVSGEVEVRLPDKRPVLTAGEFFGEIALLERRARTATIVSRTSCRLLVLEAHDLEQLLEEHPDMKQELHELVRRRLET